MIHSVIHYDTFWQVLKVVDIDDNFGFNMLVRSMRKFPYIPLSLQVFK